MAGTKNSTIFDVYGEDSEYFDSPQLSVTPETKTEQTTPQTTTPQTTTQLATSPLQRFAYTRTPYLYGNYNTTSTPMFDHPAYDPNAGRLEAYDREYAKYMAELRNSGRRRVNLKRANEAFEQRFNESWQQGELGRRNAYFADRRQKLDEYWNSRMKEHEDAIAEAYEQEGYTFDATTGKWKAPTSAPTPSSAPAPLITEGLDFNNTRAVLQWLMNHGQKLEQYGDDGHYGTETNNAITAILNDPNINLSEEERQKFITLQNSWKNKLIGPRQTTPQTTPVQQSTVNNTPTFKGADNYSTRAALLSDFEKQYNDYLGGLYTVDNSNGAALINRDIRSHSGYDQALDAFMSRYQKNGWLMPSYSLIPESRQGGILIKKHQQGGNMELDIQAQVKQLVQAVAAGDQLAAEQVKQIMQAAEQGDQQALQIAQMILAEIEAIKSAKRGAKLNYIKSLRGNCPDGEEVVYFKKGGEICKVCQKKHDKMVAEKGKKLNPIEEFKKGRKTKKC